jgi:hypothetical protein
VLQIDADKVEDILMKRFLLLLIGFLPLLIGYIQNHLMLTVFYDRVFPGVLVSIAMLVVWFLVGILSKKLINTKKAAVILMNVPALLVLLLIFLQEIVLGAFWLNNIGLATQIFYLPLIGVVSNLSRFLPQIGISLLSILAFLCMLGASYFGCTLAERRK